MIQLITNISQIELIKLEKIVLSHPISNFFQTQKFIDLINSVPNYKANVIIHKKKHIIQDQSLYVPLEQCTVR